MYDNALKKLWDAWEAEPTTLNDIWDQLDRGQEEEAPATKVDLPTEVERDRSNRPRLVSAMLFVFQKHGVLHPTEVAKKLVEHGISPNSKNLVDYIRYTLSKNKAFFKKVPGRRGYWRAAELTPSPTLEEEPVVALEPVVVELFVETLPAVETHREEPKRKPAFVSERGKWAKGPTLTREKVAYWIQAYFYQHGCLPTSGTRTQLVEFDSHGRTWQDVENWGRHRGFHSLGDMCQKLAPKVTRNRLKFFREVSGLNEDLMAQALSMDEEEYVAYETQLAEPTYELAQEMANFHCTRVADMFPEYRAYPAPVWGLEVPETDTEEQVRAAECAQVFQRELAKLSDKKHVRKAISDATKTERVGEIVVRLGNRLGIPRGRIKQLLSRINGD